MNFYLEVAVKLIIGLFSLVLAINVSGKGNLAPTAAIDQVQNFVLGGIVGGMIYNSAITILQYTLVLLIWLILVMTLKWLRTNNMLMKHLIDGRPLLLLIREPCWLKTVEKPALLHMTFHLSCVRQE